MRAIRHAQHEGVCPKDWGKDVVHYCKWEVRSIDWFGGATVTDEKSIPATPGYYCGPQSAGTHFNNDYGTAGQWSSNFQVGAALGLKCLNLKATYGTTTQTGYDVNALMYYHFNRRGYICGTNGPPSTAAQLVARPHKT